jgi:transposase
VKKVELFEIIRKEYFQDKKSIRQIARAYMIHRRQVRQAISSSMPPIRKKCGRICSVLTDSVKPIINQWLEEDLKAPRKQKHTGKRIYDRLVDEFSFVGMEGTVRIYVSKKRKELSAHTKVFIPQLHAPGVEAEVDWYEAMVDFQNSREKIYIFHMRACFSGKEFHMSFRHQNQQAFIEGHIAAFNYFGGVFKIIRYDNLTSAVKKVLRGRKRIETERFIAMRSHYLFESFFCLPGIQGAHEKGGVECGGGRFRRTHFVPVPKVSGLNELNQFLLDACKKDDQRIIIGKSETIETSWQIESLQLSCLPKEAFSTHDVVTVRVDRKSLISVKNNYYSVPVAFVGQDVEAHVTAETIIVMKQGKVIAENQRCYGMRQIISELTHYLPILKYKPGALDGSVALHQARQNGKWPAVLEKYWQELILRYGKSDANKQLIDFLLWAQDFDLHDIENLITTAMDLGCYQPESVKTLMRKQNDSCFVEPLDENSLGELKRYNRPTEGVNNYNVLLIGGTL